MTGTEIRKKNVPLIVLLAILLIATSPAATGSVFAAPYEDCDFDGYDDHTGKKLPWPGFDETRGDVLPAGWNFGESSNAESGDSGGKDKKTEEKKSAADEKKKEDTKKSPVKKDSSQTDGKKTESKKSSEKADANAGKKETASDTKQKDAPEQKAADTSEGAAAETESAGTGAAIQKTAADLAAEQEAAAQASAAAILSQKGSLTIAETEGRAITPGSTLIITGSGFAGNVDALEIQLSSSSPQTLDTVATDAGGGFSLRVSLPEGLETGDHDIVVRYQGEEITRLPVQVSLPEAAEEEGNGNQLAGILILAGLAVIAAIVIVIAQIRRRKKATGKA